MLLTISFSPKLLSQTSEFQSTMTLMVLKALPQDNHQFLKETNLHVGRKEKSLRSYLSICRYRHQLSSLTIPRSSLLPQIFLYIYILPGFPTNASEFSSFVTRLRACTLL